MELGWFINIEIFQQKMLCGRLVFISNIIFNLTIHPLPLNFNTSIGLMKIRC